MELSITAAVWEAKPTKQGRTRHSRGADRLRGEGRGERVVAQFRAEGREAPAFRP